MNKELLESLAKVEKRALELQKLSLENESSLTNAYESIDGVLKSIAECQKELKCKYIDVYRFVVLCLC
jgi:hypothetical protein